MPALLLLALGLTGSRWPIGWRELPATAVCLAIGLLTVLLLVTATAGARLDPLMELPPEALIVLPTFGYLAAHVYFWRKPGIDTKRLVLACTAGLFTAYPLLGFTLVSAACGYRSAGC